MEENYWSAALVQRDSTVVEALFREDCDGLACLDPNLMAEDPDDPLPTGSRVFLRMFEMERLVGTDVMEIADPDTILPPALLTDLSVDPMAVNLSGGAVPPDFFVFYQSLCARGTMDFSQHLDAILDALHGRLSHIARSCMNRKDAHQGTRNADDRDRRRLEANSIRKGGVQRGRDTAPTQPMKRHHGHIADPSSADAEMKRGLTRMELKLATWGGEAMVEFRSWISRGGPPTASVHRLITQLQAKEARDEKKRKM